MKQTSNQREFDKLNKTLNDDENFTKIYLVKLKKLFNKLNIKFPDRK